MNDRPNAVELLRIANQTLAQEIIPDANAEQLYTLRMIANALGIATRELESRAHDEASELHGLTAIYNTQALPAELPALHRRFAADIRAGRFEENSAQATQVRQHLLAAARAKLAVTYPKGLVAK